MKKSILLISMLFGLLSIGFAQNNGFPTRTDSVGCNSLTSSFAFVPMSGTPVSYNWIFGDGNTSTMANPTHTYTANGTYYPYVVVTFTTGGPQSFFFGSGPTFVGPPDIWSIQSFGTICGPDNYEFRAFTDSASRGVATYNWTMFYPDGTSQNSTALFPNFNMNLSGTYTLRYRTWIDPACPDSMDQTFTVDTVNFNAVITDASCGANNGSISVSPSGGVFQGFVFWSTGDSGNVINNLAPGTYVGEFLYGPNFQCVARDSFTVGVSGTLDYSISSVNVACEQDSTGEIDITINSSDGPVNFLWSNGATTEDLTNLPGGTYTVTISDNSCSFSETIVIDGDSLDVTFTSTDSDCAGNGGSLEVFVTGGQSPYTYSWSNGVTTSINPNIAAGGYSVVVTDATGCADREVAFVEPADSCFYTVSGKVFYDENGNCIMDGNDFYITSGLMILDNGAQYTSLDSSGTYTFTVPSGTYDIEPSSFSFPYFSPACPAGGSHNTTVTFSDVNGLDFAMTPDTNLIDLAVYMTIGPIRPGFNHRYYVVAYNFGATPMSGLVSFTHDQAVTYQSSSPSAVNYDPATRTAIWSFNNLLPGRWERYEITGYVPPSTQLGTAITSLAEVGPITNDVDPVNNSTQQVRLVVGSFDPNDKQVIPEGEGPEGFIEPTDDIMEYTIRFQNTGNFPAEFVVLRDTLDANLALASLKPVAASHPYKLTMKGNAMEVRFDNINLPDSASDPAGSQGYFKFVIRHDGVLAPLTEISNQAAIYFDFNKPIYTNTVVNTIAEPSSVVDPAKDGILLYPNPTRGLFQVNGLNVDIEQVRVFDITGREVLRTDQQLIDLSGEKEGVYLVQIQSNKGLSVKRISLRK
ncbi:MAG: T9SS type A sorting domain-containing protein [Bacteroidia bacterium]|nr:T9SS type A sorting domain-containing protein [Bacteroidia bacterium]